MRAVMSHNGLQQEQEQELIITEVLSEWKEQHILRPIQRFTSKTLKYETVTWLFLEDR